MIIVLMLLDTPYVGALEAGLCDGFKKTVRPGDCDSSYCIDIIDCSDRD